MEKKSLNKELEKYEEKILHKYLDFSTYNYSIVGTENNGNYTIVEIQEFDPLGKIESEYDLYIHDGKIENINGDILCGIYGTYAASTDITFIMLDFYHDNEVERTEVIGFCYGNEEENTTELFKYIGDLVAEFTV